VSSRTGTGAGGPGEGSHGAGRTLAAPAYPDDDGAPDPALRAALRDSRRSGDSDDVAVLAALRDARVLVPVVAVLDELSEPADPGHPVHGDVRQPAGDTQSSMAAVLLAGRDGRRALLAFSGLDTLLAWDRQARPVPVGGIAAAQSALADGAVALVVDLGSPAMVTVQGDDLQALAAGLVPVALADGRSGWLHPHPPRG
jgi:hypothetical protein